MPDTAHRRQASTALAIGVFGIGWAAILVRWTGVPGMVSAFYRLAIAAVILVPWYLYKGHHRRQVSRTAKWAAIIAGVFFGADLAFFNTAIMMTNAANATLLGVNAPIFVAAGVWMLDGERPSNRFWIGFALAMAGMIFVVGFDVLRHPTFGLGDLYAILGAAFYGAYQLYVRRARADMDTLTFSTWAVCAGAASLLPVLLLAKQPIWGFGPQTWWSLLGLALVTQVIGHLAVAYALGHLPVTMTSIVLLAQAPLTAVIAWPVLGEPIHATQAVGGLLLLAGMVVVNLGNRKTATGSTEEVLPASETLHA
jgi:drug/metabolite transporter (DMT)-like permease